MSKKAILILVLLNTLLFSCKKAESPDILKTGIWRGHIDIQGEDLPFNFEIKKAGDRISISLINGQEQFDVDKVFVFGDSLAFKLHIFDIEIRAKIKSDSLIGKYTKNYAEDYNLPFYAVHGQLGRFDHPNSDQRFDGRWETYFTNRDSSSHLGIGIFNAKDSIVNGTFLIQSGDYRYLEGYNDADTLYLYTFDGNHMYKFRGELRNDSLVNGQFWSGKTGFKTFVATRNESIALANPNTLSFLKEGYEKISFKFPNTSGDSISLDDPRYQNKVVIIQILGSWCPNCMDETKFLAKWYEENKSRGVEIIGLAYETKPDFSYAKERIEILKKQFGVDYEILIAGISNTSSASESLPMISKVLAFPTTIILDRTGEVKRIHTGFSGPATGEHYENFIQEFNNLIDEITD